MKKDKKISNFGYLLMWRIFWVLMKIWYNPKFYGKENIPKKGSVIIASNHIYKFDGFTVGMATKRPVHFLTKKELHDSWKTGWLFRFIGTIPVDRKNKDEAAKEKSLELLRRGEAYGIFPEGTINRKKETLFLPFKYGAVSFAKKTDSPIVPVVIYGKYKFRSKDLSVKIGEPFKVTDLELEEANKLLEEKMTDLYHELEEINRRT